MTYFPTVENGGLPTADQESLPVGVVNAIANNTVDITTLFDKAITTERRHAELAALVSELTVAVEALERKVETLVRLDLEDAGLLTDSTNTASSEPVKG